MEMDEMAMAIDGYAQLVSTKIIVLWNYFLLLIVHPLVGHLPLTLFSENHFCYNASRGLHDINELCAIDVFEAFLKVVSLGKLNHFKTDWFSSSDIK